ncbi:hypothetical protein M6B38_299115 [Iris pallida]|uniref:Uncharacterized protein n=1 Tax=Iris pallida TaxID=29817 RepID=A0AAX6HQV7_IRIPA|nr:hypothetical protein M6B38_299115 [Iris pallida]
METDIITLKEEMAIIKKIIKSNPPRTTHQSSSSVHGTSKVPEQSNLPKTYLLKDFKRKHVAFGRLNSDTPPNEDV